MSSVPSRVPKWPFIFADLVLFGIAAFITWQSPRPLPELSAAVVAFCGICGASIFVLPFLRDHQADSRLSESVSLENTVAQVKHLELIGSQIIGTSQQWQSFQLASKESLQAVRDISDKMTQEARNFSEFLAKANESEKAHMRLEVEKLKRSEAEWVQLTLHLLDHVQALHDAGQRSGQPNLMSQLAQFQRSCRDVVRKVGLVPVPAQTGELFEAGLHVPAKQNGVPPTGKKIVEVVASGYTYQGQLVRKSLVLLESSDGESAASPNEKSAAVPTTQSLEAKESKPSLKPVTENELAELFPQASEAPKGPAPA